MKYHQTTYRAHRPGQSLPLIALMIVLLVAMVGLSVDVGNTFAQERQAVAAANAASLAGMNVVIRRGPSDTNEQVYNAVVASLQANGVEVAPYGESPTGEQVDLQIAYLDPQGRSLAGMTTVTPSATDIPYGVGFVQVTLAGRVGTFFARVVGRPDLPIGANAYAGQCALGDGVYPIAVDQAMLDSEQGQMRRPNPPDADNDGVIDDHWRMLPSGYSARRLYVHSAQDSQPGSFGFLRWKADKGQTGRSSSSAQELEASLSGVGNLAWGFDEAPERGAPNGQLNAPDSDYPSRPGELNEGDWVYGTRGWKQGGQESAIAEHIAAGSILILPIYNDSTGPGADKNDDNAVRFKIVEFGRFTILEQGQEQGRKYFDLVYMGKAAPQSVPCQFSAVPVNDDACCELWGDVAFWPEYQVIPQTTQPIQYMVVLDLSGSMSANFNGQCDMRAGGGNPPLRNPPLVGEPDRFWQCANGPTYTSALDGSPVPGTTEVTGTGSNQYWSTERERRIYVAKQAIKAMIGKLYMPGNESFEASPDLYPPDQFGFVWFNQQSPLSAAYSFEDGHPFTSDPQRAIDAVINTTTGRSSYLVDGGTNAASGLYRAWTIFRDTPTTVMHQPTGKVYTYKRVVIFITDGVSNQIFSESAANLLLTQSTSNTFTPSSELRDENGTLIAGLAWEECRDIPSNLVIENARCQTTLYGGHYVRGGVRYDRPISQAIDVSNRYLKGNSIDVFVLALSSLPETGLSSGIPSNPSYYRSAADLIYNPDGTTNVDQIMLSFQAIVNDDRCQRGLDPSPLTSFAADRFRAIPLTGGETLNYPNVGQVTVSNSVTGQPFTTFIKVDQDGRLRYRFGERIPPGAYTLSATLFYINPRDPGGAGSPARAYGDLWTGAGSEAQIAIEVKNRIQSGSLVPATRVNLDLRLSGDVCAGR
jgi:hypothetical protein